MTLPQGYAHATGRPVTMGTRGMVATPHYLASAAGYSALQQGGSAVDAAITMDATLAVVYDHMGGLGGDVFAQVWEPQSGRLYALNGSGWAGEQVTIDSLHSRGCAEIPARGPLAAITVPGAVAGWQTLHQRFGRLEWPALLAPAIHYARHGFPLSQRLRDQIYACRKLLRRFAEAAPIFLPGGSVPPAGSLFRQPDLARSLELIASEGARCFYEGDLAERLVGGLQEAGGLLTGADFAAHSSEWVEPLRTTYHGYEVTQLPPNTQGIATLLLLNLLERFDMQALGEGTADYYHLMAEAVKLAFADRDRWVADPAFLDIPYEKLLSKERAQERARQIDMQQAAHEVAPGVTRQGDTVYLAAVDGEGQAVSLIQSVFFEFGWVLIPPGTGILLQNRGSAFSLDPQDPNHLEPGKRAFHTLIPAMALQEGQPVLLFGAMGGEGQPQTQAAMLTRMVDFGFNVQEAIEAPRWLYGKTWGADSKSLKLEARVPDGILQELERRGHRLEVVKHTAQAMGHAQGIWIDRQAGILHGGADPRGDGSAIGY